MAMIKCPEPDCGNMVSDQAPSCPRCGYPLRKVEYKFIDVIYHSDGTLVGVEQYDALERDGWQVVEKSKRDLFNDDGHCYAEVTSYKFQR